jgi:hypothetical protein
VELTFSDIPSAPTALWLRAYHNAQHTITVSIYKYTTSAWESYQVLPSAQSGYTFYSIPIPDGSDHVSAGAARVQFAYTGEGSLDAYLYVDYCALVKAGLGSETIDVARTWSTIQTFPTGKLVADHADISGLGTMALVASPCPIADGGTGASTLAGAGIPQKLASWIHTGIASAGGGGWHTIAAATAPAGYYRLSFYSRVTTVGSTQDYLTVTLRGYEGASRSVPVPGTYSVTGYLSNEPSGVENALTGVPSGANIQSGSAIVYHDGTATKAVDWTYNLVLGGNGPPDAVFSLYTVAEYLGA